MAGLSAAAKAASEGASVVLVEKGAAIGGSAAYAGFIWTAPTVEVMREVNPDGDPVLGRRVVEGYDDALDVGPLARRARRRPGHRARLRPRVRRPTWRTSCSPCERLVRERGEAAGAQPRARGCSRRTEPWSAPRSRRRAATRADPRAPHAARHRRLRRRSRPARRAHRARGAGHPAAREPATAPATACASAEAAGAASATRRRLLRPPDPVRASSTRTRTSSRT